VDADNDTLTQQIRQQFEHDEPGATPGVPPPNDLIPEAVIEPIESILQPPNPNDEDEVDTEVLEEARAVEFDTGDFNDNPDHITDEETTEAPDGSPTLGPLDSIPEQGRYNLQARGVQGSTATAPKLTAERLGHLNNITHRQQIRPTAITLPSRAKAIRKLLDPETVKLPQMDCFLMIDEKLDSVFYQDEGQPNVWAEYAKCDTTESELSHILHYIMTQYSFKAAVKKFGKGAEDAALKELDQLHYQEAFTPIDRNSFTTAQRRAALESIMTIKEKRDGTIKGRYCADGRKQRDYMPREEASSPTVHMDSVFITAIIDAKENLKKKGRLI
jgi:hypothetical protein